MERKLCEALKAAGVKPRHGYTEPWTPSGNISNLCVGRVSLMSMPKLYVPNYDLEGPTGQGTRLETVLANIMLSVAMQEYALAHMMNAKGEEIQMFSDPENPMLCEITMDDYEHMSDSIQNLMKSIEEYECSLSKKLILTMAAACENVDSAEEVNCPQWPDANCGTLNEP
ncbi:MAG: hypothetical protein LBS11_01165 [Oscillospiraceae bacterium]|jgi:hypothetical protein|nr:hypothetical protein [Oscillospiraceae bacterium]